MTTGGRVGHKADVRTAATSTVLDINKVPLGPVLRAHPLSSAQPRTLAAIDSSHPPQAPLRLRSEHNKAHLKLIGLTTWGANVLATQQSRRKHVDALQRVLLGRRRVGMH